MTIIYNRSILKHRALLAFFQSRFDSYKTERQIILSLRLVSVMIIFVLILPIIVKLDKINNRLLGIYKLIPIDDIKML